MKQEFFPDGTPIDAWFYDTKIPEIHEMGTQYILTDYGVQEDGSVQTEAIQKVIDLAFQNGGGVVVVPKGTFLTGALFFKQGVNLYIEEGATLLGSDDIADYPVCDTRIEGQSCKYFAALINADGIDGFTMCGKGTIDGNGLRSWRAFWIRREWNPDCTNKDEQRPRLVYISNCENVLVANLRMQNSHFWTNHVYKSHHVKYIGCDIFSPTAPVPAPSTDGIDIDVCTDVLVKGCRVEVNDDGIVLKGGKGPWADEDPTNGANERIIVEDCVYGYCHGCLTCGSESIHNKNIILRRTKVLENLNLMWLKMRPDTPQKYEHILIEDVSGKVSHFLTIFPWTQFFDMQGREDIPLSFAENITMRNCDFICKKFFNVEPDESQYVLSDFTLENLNIQTEDDSFDKNAIKNMRVHNVNLEGVKHE